MTVRCLGGVGEAETAELRWGGSGGEAKERLDRLRPAGGRAHCLRFASPAEATWRLEAKRCLEGRRLEDYWIRKSENRRIDGLELWKIGGQASGRLEAGGLET